jgi:DNA-binding response OmpR family regulator
MTNRRVLVVDDEQEILSQFAEQIAEEGYDVLPAQNGVEAWEIFQGTTILVVVTDIHMPFKNGLKVLEEIKNHSPATRVIIVTGFGGEPEAIKALRLHAFDYIQKGRDTTVNDVLEAIKRAFRDVDVQVRAEKQMLAFLTHTLSNTLSGGPITAEYLLTEARAMLGNRYEEEDVQRFVNNIASLKTTLLAMESMLRAYKIFVKRPELLEQNWRQDVGGTQSFADLLSVVMKQTLASLLFEETNVDQVERLVATFETAEVGVVRQTFLNELLWPQAAAESKQVLRWCQSHFPIISLKTSGSIKAFDPSGVRYSFLFSVLSEILYNSLKYTDGREPIRIDQTVQGGLFCFVCENTFDDVSTQSSGSRKGLEFVHGLAQMLDGIEIIHQSKDEKFRVELRIPVDLLN